MTWLPTGNEEGGIDAAVGSSLTLTLEVDGRIGLEWLSCADVLAAFGSLPSSSSSLSHRLATSSKLITTELPEAPCARRARSLHGRPAIKVLNVTRYNDAFILRPLQRRCKLRRVAVANPL